MRKEEGRRMTTDEYGKCPRCGRYDLKGIVQDDWVYVYCLHCYRLEIVESEE